MRLTIEQIKEITFGAIKIAEEENGLRFYRCTENQIGAFSKLQDNFTVTSSGVRFDFHTDSKTLSFDAAGSPDYEVMLDGLLHKHIKVCEYQERGEKILCDLGEGEKRVTFLFPSCGLETWLKYFELDDGAKIIPHKYTGKKFYFLGDSITQGYNSTYNFLALPHALSRRFDIDFVSCGVGGWGFVPKSVDKIPYKPDYAMILMGTNDWAGSKYHGTTPEDFVGILNRTLDKFEECFPGVKTILVSPVWRCDIDNELPIGALEGVAKQIEKSAEERGFLYINGFKLLPHSKDFIHDHVHPNNLGFAVYAERLAAELEKIIEL